MHRSLKALLPNALGALSLLFRSTCTTVRDKGLYNYLRLDFDGLNVLIVQS
jgi:hypothetical protein